MHRRKVPKRPNTGRKSAISGEIVIKRQTRGAKYMADGQMRHGFGSDNKQQPNARHGAQQPEQSGLMADYRGRKLELSAENHNFDTFYFPNKR